MSIQFRCPHCGIIAGVATEFTGQVMTCGRCGRFATIPFPPVGPSPTRNDGEVVFLADTVVFLADNRLADREAASPRLVDPLGPHTPQHVLRPVGVPESVDSADPPLQITSQDILTPSNDPGVFFVGIESDILFLDEIPFRHAPVAKPPVAKPPVANTPVANTPVARGLIRTHRLDPPRVSHAVPPHAIRLVDEWPDGRSVDVNSTYVPDSTGGENSTRGGNSMDVFVDQDHATVPPVATADDVFFIGDESEILFIEDEPEIMFISGPRQPLGQSHRKPQWG